MTNLFKKLVFTDKAIDDLTVAVQAGKSITVERAVLSGWTPPDDDQVYTPYKNSSGALDVAAVKANINKYFDKTEALKNTAPAWVEGILKPKTVKQKNKNTLNFALDFENTDFDHDVAAKYYGYTSWAELLDNMSEFNIDAQSVALLAQDDTGLEYVFAFAKIESDDSLKYPAALTTELTHKLHIDLFINITQSDNVVINYTPDGLVEYNEFEQHVELANNTYAKKVDVYTKIESDDKFLTQVEAAQEYATKEENAQKADKTSVYTKTETYPKTQLYTQAEVNELLSAHLIRTTDDIEKYQLSSILDAKKGNYYFFNEELIPDWIKNYNLTYNNRCMVEIVVQGYIRSYDNNEVFVRFTTYLHEDKAASYYGWGSSNEKMKWYDSQGNRVNSQ